jgi:hypothetical protein
VTAIIIIISSSSSHTLNPKKFISFKVGKPVFLKAGTCSTLRCVYNARDHKWLGFLE